MTPKQHDDFQKLYDELPDPVLFSMLQRIVLQMQQRKYLNVDDTLTLYAIVESSIDNAIRANTALFEANAILRGDV